jgi:uncharacterized protein (TIGR02598 family)
LEKLQAFSLVEIAIAIAVLAVAFVALIGLVPLGLTNFRDAMDTVIGSQIAQRVITDAEQTDFDLLLAEADKSSGEFFNLPVRFFDDQAREVFPAKPGAEAAAIYRALVRGSRPGPRDVSTVDGDFTSLPAELGKPRFEPRDSIFLTIQVAHRPGLAPLKLGTNQLWPPRSAPLSTYRTVITRNGTTTKLTATP